MTITSATKYGNNICKGTPHALRTCSITSAINYSKLHHSAHKITGHTNTHKTSSVGKLIRITFSSDQKKPCLKTGKSLSFNKI